MGRDAENLAVLLKKRAGLNAGPVSDVTCENVGAGDGIRTRDILLGRQELYR